MATKTAQMKESRGRSAARKITATKRRRLSIRAFRKTFERNLIAEGYSPAEAKEIVKDVTE